MIHCLRRDAFGVIIRIIYGVYHLAVSVYGECKRDNHNDYSQATAY